MPKPGKGSSSPSSFRLRRLPALFTVLAAVPLVAAHAALLTAFDPASRPGLALALLALAEAALIFATLLLERTGMAEPWVILGVAVVLRLLLLPLPPTLSDDLYRYVWDGKVATSGENPYRWAPDAPELASLRDETWSHVAHRDVPTVYPPLALSLFSIAARMPRPLLALKCLLTAADLAACWLLAGIGRRLGVSPARVAWYAWNPLVTLEVAGMGHLDPLGVVAVLVTVGALLDCPRRSGTAAVGAAAGVLAKLAPLAALPMWARQSGHPRRFLGVAGGLLLTSALPVLVATGGIPPGLVRYGVSWEFNGPVFEPLWRLIAAVGAPARLARAVDTAKRLTDYAPWWNAIYPYLYPQFLAKVLLAGAMAWLVVRSLSAKDPVAGVGRLFGGLLLLSATVYPWYLLWVLPWAALRRHPAWIALSGLVLLSYLPRLFGVPLVPWVMAAIWLPFGALLVLGPGWSSTA